MPDGYPIVSPDFIRLACGQDVTVGTLIGKCLELGCVVSSVLEPLSLKDFKDGALISDSFSLSFESPDDDDLATYTFVVSTETCGDASCGDAFALFRILS